MRIIFFIVLMLVTSMPAQAEESPKLITNRDASGDKVLQPVTEKPLLHDVYDLSFVAYDAAFAKEFGLADAHVTEMDKHLRYMEIRMVTEGQQTNCYYNLIIDKAVDIDFPEENFYFATKTPELFFPWDYKKKPETSRQSLITKQKFEEYHRFDNRTYIANRGYKFHPTGAPFSGGGYGGATVQYYIQDYPVPFHILSTAASCENAPYDFPGASFWIRKKGHAEMMHPQMEDHYTFTIPVSIVKQIYPFLKSYTAAEDIRIRNLLNQK